MNGNEQKLYAIRYTLYATRGFTLLEALLVIALLTVSAGIGLAAFSSLYRQSDLEAAESSLVAFLRLAQTKAAAGQGEQEWGVKIEPNKAILFQGLSFASRDPAHDEVLDISAAVALSGLDEVVFNRPVGTTTDIGIINIMVDGLPERTLGINEYGVIEY
jgi:prepilin-type N-terminal cleavage/methylation domain-containing protein